MEGVRLNDFLARFPDLLDDIWYRPSPQEGREPELVVSERVQTLYWRWRDLMEEMYQIIQENTQC